MDRHDLNDDDLALDGEPIVKERMRRRSAYGIRWALSSAVAEFCDCKTWGKRYDPEADFETTIIFFGRQSDTLFARWLLETLHQFVLRQTRGYQPKPPRSAWSDEPTEAEQRRAFAIGCTARIAARLTKAATERSAAAQAATVAPAVTGTGKSLVAIKQGIIEAEYAKLGLKLRGSPTAGLSFGFDRDSYARGQAAGAHAGFSRPVHGGAPRALPKR